MACGSPDDRRAGKVVGKFGDSENIVAAMGRGSGDGDCKMIGALQELETMLIQIGHWVIQADKLGHQLASFRKLTHQRVLVQ